MSSAKKKVKRKLKPWAIVLDFDDTCSSFLGSLCDTHNSIWGGTIHPSNITAWNWDDIDVKDSRGNRVLGKELENTFKKYERCIYSQMPPFRDTKKTLDMIKHWNYHIIVVTARDEKFRLETEFNFKAYGLPIDELYFTSDKVSKIKELSKRFRIAAFADDKASTVESINNNCKVNKTYMVRAGHNADVEVDDDITVINSIFQILADLKDRNK